MQIETQSNVPQTAPKVGIGVTALAVLMAVGLFLVGVAVSTVVVYVCLEQLAGINLNFAQAVAGGILLTAARGS